MLFQTVETHSRLEYWGFRKHLNLYGMLQNQDLPRDIFLCWKAIWVNT